MTVTSYPLRCLVRLDRTPEELSIVNSHVALWTADVGVSPDANVIVAVLSDSYVSFLPLRSLLTAHGPEKGGAVLQYSYYLEICFVVFLQVIK